MNWFSGIVFLSCSEIGMIGPQELPLAPENSHDLIHPMNLSLPTINLEKYKSASQRARVGTESWGSSNFFCSSCESPRLEQASRNTAAFDFACPICKSTFH